MGNITFVLLFNADKRKIIYFSAGFSFYIFISSGTYLFFSSIGAPLSQGPWYLPTSPLTAPLDPIDNLIKNRNIILVCLNFCLKTVILQYVLNLARKKGEIQMF